MMVGPVEHPRHRTVTALRSSQLSLTFSALCCRWPVQTTLRCGFPKADLQYAVRKFVKGN
jgi:hypothetical protein